MVKRKTYIVKRNIHGDVFLINSKQNYLNDKCPIYEINEIGEFIWENIAESIELSKLVSLIIGAINDDVDENVVLIDTKEYLELLSAEGFLEEYE